VHHGINPGPKSYLSPTEEKDLAAFLVDSAKVGYGRSCQQVKFCRICDKGSLEANKVLS